MKKILNLILALALCLGITACGTSVPEETEPQTQPTESLEELYGDHYLFQFLYGEWEQTEEGLEEGNPYNTMTLREDGTCIVDGQEGTWCITEYTDENKLCIQFNINGNAELGLYMEGRGSFYATVSGMMCPGSWENKTGIPLDENDIALTIENWKDYFDLKVEEEYREDAFGDLEYLTLNQYLELKPEYAEKLIVQDVVMEIACTEELSKITVDTEDRTYTLGEALQRREGAKDIRTMSNDGRIYVPITVSGNIIVISDYLDTETTTNKSIALVPDLDAIEVLRIQGAVYLANN